MTVAHLTLESSNTKTGPIPVSTTESSTCPEACPFKAAGCYADGGPLAIHWARVSEHDAGFDWPMFCDAIETLPAGTLWRHNQAGDLPGSGGSIDKAEFIALIAANRGKRGFTYTHKPMDSELNRDLVRFANQSGFTVNLSANNLTHADALADLEIAPVVVVLPEDQRTNTLTPAGRRVVICPAISRDDVTCATCQLCQRQHSTIVGFPAHGSSKRKASAIAGIKITVQH